MMISGLVAAAGRGRLWLLGWPRACALAGGWVGIPLCRVWFPLDDRPWQTALALFGCIWAVQIGVWIRDDA